MISGLSQVINWVSFHMIPLTKKHFLDDVYIWIQIMVCYNGCTNMPLRDASNKTSHFSSYFRKDLEEYIAGKGINCSIRQLRSKIMNKQNKHRLTIARRLAKFNSAKWSLVCTDIAGILWNECTDWYIKKVKLRGCIVFCSIATYVSIVIMMNWVDYKINHNSLSTSVGWHANEVISRCTSFIVRSFKIIVISRAARFIIVHKILVFWTCCTWVTVK